MADNRFQAHASSDPEPTHEFREVPGHYERLRNQPHQHALETAAGGSMMEAIGGVGAVGLAILGLVGVLPAILGEIATIAIGVALVSKGRAISAHYSDILHDASDSRVQAAELGSGVTVEFIGGLGGIVLGIPALIGVIPGILIPVALIGFGGALLLSSGETTRLDAFATSGPEFSERSRHAAGQAAKAASGAQIMLGLGATALGILALVLAPVLALSLVGLLAVGTAIMFSGGVLTGRMTRVIHH
jgi:hypothetical protein